MTWRRPVEELEALDDGYIPVLLDCGHVRVGARFRKSDGMPCALQWCGACHSAGRVAAPPRPDELTVRLTRAQARYVAGTLSAMVNRRELEHPDIAQEVIDAFHRELERAT